MKNEEITDRIFRQAVEAIDNGDTNTLEGLLKGYPYLVFDYFPYPEGAYFKNPYLLWFVADNPIRQGKLADNIVDIAKLIIRFVKQEAEDSAQYQLDYALGLVATGRIPRECGVQIQLIDILIDEGAKPGCGLGALAHGNAAAAARLIERGGQLTLAAAVGLDFYDDITRLAASASADERLLALTTAAFYGKVRTISLLLNWGINPNGYPHKSTGFHTHATPLHQAVSSGSLEAVKLLVAAGADISATDKVYSGTPLGWALHMPTESNDPELNRKYHIIADYLIAKEQSAKST